MSSSDSTHTADSEIPVSALALRLVLVLVLVRLFRFPRPSSTCLALARHTVPSREALLDTGLNGRGSGWCFPCARGSGSESDESASVVVGGSSGVMGIEEVGELALLVGSLGESSGTVKS